MQHIRQLQLVHTFDRASHEMVLLLNREDLAYLADVQICFWFNATFPSGHAQTSEVADIRIYFDGEDITQKVVLELEKVLSLSDSSKAEYRTALKNWMIIFDREATLVGLTADQIKKNHALALSYASLPWKYFFSTKLSTVGYGYRGSLHPLHYIFRDIQIAPLSLRKILFPNVSDEERPLNKIKDLRLVVSHGPSRIYSKNWTPVNLQYEGIASLSAACVFDDAWEIAMRERLLRVAVRMAELSDQVTELQKKYSNFEIRAAEFKAISAGIETSLQEFLSCHGPDSGVPNA